MHALVRKSSFSKAQGLRETGSRGAVLLTVGRSYVGNDVTHSTLLDRACASSYENLPKYRSYRVSHTAPCTLSMSLVAAHFHLRNGAVLWRLNWLADTSNRGYSSSCAIMVNYRYLLDDTETNSKLYIEKQQVRVSAAVLALLPDTQAASRDDDDDDEKPAG